MLQNIDFASSYVVSNVKQKKNYEEHIYLTRMLTSRAVSLMKY